MTEEKIKIPAGFTEAMQNAAILEFRKHQQHFERARDDFEREVTHWVIDKNNKTNPLPLDSLGETLLQAFDVVVYLVLLKASVFDRIAWPKMESADGKIKIPLRIIDLIEDSHLTPIIAAIKADPQFLSHFQTRGDEDKNKIAESFLGSVINKALMAIRGTSYLQQAAGVYSSFGDFGDPDDPLKIRLADVEGTSLNLQALREKILVRRQESYCRTLNLNE